MFARHTDSVVFHLSRCNLDRHHPYHRCIVFQTDGTDFCGCDMTAYAASVVGGGLYVVCLIRILKGKD